jgi:methionine-rich copper-binding protein CopC
MHHSRRGPASRANRIARPALGLLALILFLAAPLTVAAHAELDTITPANKATTDGSPTAIVATFTEGLDPGASSLRIVDASGAVVLEGGEVTSDDPRTLTLAVTTPLAPGAYTVRWTSKSAADGDVAHGITTFTVAAAPSEAPSASASPAASASAPGSVAPSDAPSAAPSLAPSPSAGPSTPATSTSDALIPIVAVLILIGAIGAWLLRGRGRAAR